MPDKRYQVFVSSTFRDLEAERQEVMHALLELDCMPSGMELFPAANETQWNLIKKVIDDCDYYILIVAGRYGSIGPEGYSYTEMEYRYAQEIGKPIISFLHRSPGQIVADKTEQSTEGKEKLAAFRGLVEKRLCKHWGSPAELGSVVSRSLIQLIKAEPGIGWVRANELPDQDATLELLRLRRQVEELQGELARSRKTAPKGAEDFAQGAEAHTFACTLAARPPDDYNYKYWSLELVATWDDVFSAVAPLMIHEAAEPTLRVALNEFATERMLPQVRKMKDVSGHRLKEITLDDSDFQTVKIQLRAIGLMAKSEKARSVKDSGTYWTLTPYGDEVMTRLRAIRRTAGESKTRTSGATPSEGSQETPPQVTDPREFFQAACAAEVAGTKVMPNCSLTVWVVVSLLLMAMAAFGYSPEVLACFKAIGNGWQARMDGVLKDYIAQRSRRALSSTSATA